MIKKMRRRFILVAILAFAMVSAVLIAGINVVNYVQTTERQDEMTAMLIGRGGLSQEAPPDMPDNPPMPTGEGLQPPQGPGFDDNRDIREFGREAQFTTRYFAVTFGESGETEKVDADFISDIDDETAVEYAQKVIATGKEKGYYNHFRYRVKSIESPDSGEVRTVVLFLDSETQQQFINRLLMLSVGIGILGLAAVFVLIVILSRKAMRPFEKNIERQKQFITDAGHELKTPITSITTSADIAAMEHPEDEWIANIQKQTVRLSKLTANLVALSRLDEEEPFADKASFSLSDAAWEIAESFTAVAEAKKMAYTQEIADGLTYYGNREGVQQIISILLDNALKYSTETGDIKLKVYAKGKKSIIEVENSCRFEQAIDPERLFDRFYRVEDSHATSTGGTGIGLSMARAIAEAHNGKIEAFLPIEGKICFKVTL
ncbi:MAG: HAMP domain-containing histidine kinase [Firmicutes bacterium]|nr:HAMP domain-containing histidine kinase [Bacillota bacterium]